MVRSLARRLCALLVLLVLHVPAVSAQPAPAGSGPARSIVLEPDLVWDGASDAPQRGWVVLVRGARIEAAGPASAVTAPAGAEHIALAGTTLMPGLIEGHSHLFLHPYNETLWDD